MLDNYFYNDGSQQKPRLVLHQAWWGMIGIGDSRREWTMEEKFEKIAEAGFTGILAKIPSPEESERWRKLLDEYGFDFGVHSYPSTREELAELLSQSKQFGAQYVNSQVANSYIIGDDAVRLLSGLLAEAKQANIPYFVETHRGRITQDLMRTVEYVNTISDLRLTIDLSHYIVAGEMSPFKNLHLAEPYFNVLLERTSCIHARISNGQQIQIDAGPNGEHPMTKHFAAWWKKAMTHWLQQAGPGHLQPFIPELGPPDYAITRFEQMSRPEGEISDRWQQAMMLKRLAEEIWTEIQK